MATILNHNLTCSSAFSVTMSVIKSDAVQLIFRVLLCFVVMLPLSMRAMAEPLPPRAVLILDQSDPFSPWGIGFRTALRSALGYSELYPIAIYPEILDLSRFHGNEYEEALRAYLREKYRNKKIGVIVVHGVRALQIFLRLRPELWPNTPVVVSFIDEATADRLKPIANITGSITKLHFSSAVSAARAIVPNLKRLALVGDPFERQPYRRHYVDELRSIGNDLEIIDLSGLPLREVMQRVAALPNDAAIFYTGIYRDSEGSIYIPGESITQVSQAANRPVVTDNEALVGVGATGGFVASNVRMAEDAGLLVQRILKGERATDIPITVGEFIHPIFDWRQMQRFGISETTLPAGTEIRFRPPGIWEHYRWQMVAIFAAVVLQAGVIFGLLIERRRRRIAEQESRLRLGEVVHLNRTATAGALSASIAHELNQPLGAILCNAEAAEVLLGNKFSRSRSGKGYSCRYPQGRRARWRRHTAPARTIEET